MSAELKLRRSCVIGWPVAHSRSPLIHNYWLNRYGLQGEYTKELVSPEDLGSFLSEFRNRGFVGCNVTIPHKERAAKFVTLADSQTQKLGAVNTLYFDGAKLMGANTDGFGFMQNLLSTVPNIQTTGTRVTILGAGGAARSIVCALLEMGAGAIYLCNRSLDRATALAQSLGALIEPLPWKAAAEAMSKSDLLVNATPLGMKGMPQLDISIDALPLSSVVYDIVYVPLETALLRRARVHGHRTVDGLGMLLHQARPGFEKWFGVRPVVTDELRRLVEQDIHNSAAPPT
jgi:shikimate dehydrogenase